MSLAPSGPAADDMIKETTLLSVYAKLQDSLKKKDFTRSLKLVTSLSKIGIPVSVILRNEPILDFLSSLRKNKAFPKPLRRACKELLSAWVSKSQSTDPASISQSANCAATGDRDSRDRVLMMNAMIATPTFKPKTTLEQRVQSIARHDKKRAISHVMTKAASRSPNRHTGSNGHGTLPAQKVPKLERLVVDEIVKLQDSLEEVGDIPHFVLEGALKSFTGTNLFRVEEHNPQLRGHFDSVWAKIVKEEFLKELRDIKEAARLLKTYREREEEEEDDETVTREGHVGQRRNTVGEKGQAVKETVSLDQNTRDYLVAKGVQPAVLDVLHVLRQHPREMWLSLMEWREMRQRQLIRDVKEKKSATRIVKIETSLPQNCHRQHAKHQTSPTKSSFLDKLRVDMAIQRGLIRPVLLKKGRLRSTRSGFVKVTTPSAKMAPVSQSASSRAPKHHSSRLHPFPSTPSSSSSTSTEATRRLLSQPASASTAYGGIKRGKLPPQLSPQRREASRVRHTAAKRGGAAPSRLVGAGARGDLRRNGRIADRSHAKKPSFARKTEGLVDKLRHSASNHHRITRPGAAVVAPMYKGGSERKTTIGPIKDEERVIAGSGSERRQPSRSKVHDTTTQRHCRVRSADANSNTNAKRKHDTPGTSPHKLHHGQ